MKNVYPEWKPKGEYPTDEEGVLLVSPYWKKALQLAEEKRSKKIYLADVFIVTVGLCLSYFIYVRLFG